MLNLLGQQWGFGMDSGRPALFLFGFPIYVYALIIVFGMAMAIVSGGFMLKKRGIDPFDVTIYALIVIPIGVLGARLYVYIFPWEGRTADWSTFFDFRRGGLGIYGGVILGTVAAFVVALFKKQNFRVVMDCLIPGLFLAQSIGRWGNFVNQEAYGQLVTNPNFQWFPFAVYIDAEGAWFQATFFYESMATLLGFIVCLLFVFKCKKSYRFGWCSAFYGIYYGIVRLLIEGLRADSLYLWIGGTQTDIKISQLVSVFTILFGLYLLSRIYRQQLHGLYSKMFKSEREEVAKSRFVVLGVAVVSVAISILMFVLGGESKFIAGVLLALLAVYCVIAIFALNDRLKLYCNNCGDKMVLAESKSAIEEVDLMPKEKKHSVLFVYIASLCLILLGVFVACLAKGMTTNVPNLVVLAVIALILFGVGVAIIVKHQLYKNLNKSNFAGNPIEVCCESCAEEKQVVKLNLWLFVLFPFRKYKNYSAEGILPYVDPTKAEKNKKKAENQ